MSFFRRFDWFGFAALLALVALGTLFIWSAGSARVETVFHGLWIRNLTTAILGLVLYFLLARLDYRTWLGPGAVVAYAASLVLLVVVLLVGTEQFGGRRWLWFFQPSEVAKLGVIVLLAELFGKAEGCPFAARDSLRTLFFALTLVGVPAVLILAEPDLGTALTLVPTALVMLFASGVGRRWLVGLCAIGGLAALALLGAIYEAERPGTSPERRAAILHRVPLKDHQLKRVRAFLFPEADQLGAGYNLRQAKISIGSGGFAGKGIGKGESTHLKYLPPAISMNDFIFCVYAEETGFIGSAVLLGLFGVLLLSGCVAAFRATCGRGRLLALGVSTLVFAHVYVNIAMSIGLVPITGLPLPFISSGRTFLLTTMCGLGLVQSVIVHRKETRK